MERFAPFVAVDHGALPRFLHALSRVPHELRRHEPARHARHLASLWGVRLGEAGRATLFYADGGAVLVVVPADRKVSTPRLRALLDVDDLRVLRGDRGVGRVGWAGLGETAGALPALPALYGAGALVDPLALAPSRLVITLEPSRSVAIAPSDYVALVGARVARVAGSTQLLEAGGMVDDLSSEGERSGWAGEDSNLRRR